MASSPLLARFRHAARRPARRAGLALLALAAGAGLAAGPAAPAGATVTTIGPGADVRAAMAALRPGGTLRLLPGTYSIGYIVPRLAAGSAAHRITVTAADPADPPLLQGLLRLQSPQYWTVSHLRIQATQPGLEGFSVNGGTGWVVSDSEFFGARQTGAYTNVVIASSAVPPPRGFRFTGNCVHGAATTTRHLTDHNIYVNFHGNATSSGLIDRNLIFDHPNGAGIKLGDGGVPDAPGPWGVTVAYNTVTHGGRAVAFHGDVRYNVLHGNLFTWSSAPFVSNPKTTALWADHIPTRTNSFDHNYFWHEDLISWDLSHGVRNVTDNAFHSDPGYIRTMSCSGWQVTSPGAVRYGRYGRL